MVVAQIAYNHLTASVRSNCDALIAVPLTYTNTGTSNFITAACWADDFKANLGTGVWHYIDIPFSLDGTPTNGVSADSFDVVRAINQCVQALGNPSTTQSNQAVYLRYLLHFVGDIHQPLHASTAVFASATSGDAGGNGFIITGYGGELHALWDQGGGYVSASVPRPLSTSGKTTLSNKVAVIEADYPYVSNAGAFPDPMTWAMEGYNLAQTVAYVGINQGDAPTSSYTNAAQHTAESRLALAGHRLADLLNTLFTVYPTTLQLSAASTGSMSFSWNAVPGRTYKVQRKQNLDDTWVTVAVVTPKSGTATYSEVAGTTTRFYQVTQ
ncbi:MAG: nuclease [Verrucomicrobiales bacterium]|nr:nuclease [Verrucomicrobiales bacterium]